MSLPEFAKDLRLRGDSDNLVLASRDIVFMLYERRHQNEIKNGPLVKVASQKKVKRKRSGALELTRSARSSLASNLVVGYADLTGGPSLIHHFLWLFASLARFMGIRKPPWQSRMS